MTSCDELIRMFASNLYVMRTTLPSFSNAIKKKIHLFWLCLVVRLSQRKRNLRKQNSIGIPHIVVGIVISILKGTNLYVYSRVTDGVICQEINGKLCLLLGCMVLKLLLELKDL